MRLLTLFTLFFVTVSANSFAAPEITDEGAKKAKVVAEQYLALYAPFFAMDPESTVTQTGEIQIEKAKNYYAATLPDLTVKNTREIKGEEKAIIFKLGITSMNIAPTDDPNAWKIAVALPTPFIVTDENNEIIFEVDMGNQKMAGLWNTELEAVSRMKAEYKNIVVSMVKDQAKVKMGHIKKVYIESDSKKIADDDWSSPAKIIMDGFAFGMLNDPTKSSIKVDNITVDGTVTGYAPTQIKKLYTMMADAEAPKDGIGMPKGYFDILRQSMKSWDSNFSISGITIQDRAKKGVTQKPIKLDKAGFVIDFSDMDKPLTSNKIGFSYSGLQIDTQGQPSKESIATTFGLMLGIENLPIDKLVKFGEQAAGAAEGAADPKQKMQGAAMMAMMALPQTLAEAGTTLRLEEMKMANKHYSLGGKGYLKATTESAVGALGEANFKYTGLQKLIQFIQDALPSVTDEKKQAREKRWISRLEFLERLGEVDPNDPNIKTINFKLTPQGQTMINGRPMQEVLAAPAPQ